VLGQNVPEPGTERPHLGQTWGRLTRGRLTVSQLSPARLSSVEKAALQTSSDIMMSITTYISASGPPTYTWLFEANKQLQLMLCLKRSANEVVTPCRVELDCWWWLTGAKCTSHWQGLLCWTSSYSSRHSSFPKSSPDIGEFYTWLQYMYSM